MANQLQPDAVTLAVLAGGRGSRMGRPKDQVRIAGKTVLDYLLDRLAWPGPTLLVTAPGAVEICGSERFDRVSSDPVEGEGPLRGVLTALESCATDFLVITTVDMPGWDARKLSLLLELVRSSNVLGAMFSHEATVEPFPLALRRAAHADIAAKFERGERSTKSLSNDEQYSISAAPADWPEITWTNLNFPEEVRAFESACEWKC